MAEFIKSTTARRIANVLSHLESKKSKERCKQDLTFKSSSKCNDCLRRRNCSTSEQCSEPHDIEDLGSAKAYRRMSSIDSGDSNSAYLFDPERFQEVQKPLLEASTLPSECYTSNSWFAREMEKVFVPSWTLMGREDEISSPGEYLASDTEWGGPVAACRGTDGNIYAFANVVGL
jgi:hypothetical protein